MISEYMEKNGLFDSDILIPSKEEIERTIKNITEYQELTIDDEIVLWKMKMIRFILSHRGEKI